MESSSDVCFLSFDLPPILIIVAWRAVPGYSDDGLIDWLGRYVGREVGRNEIEGLNDSESFGGWW